MSKKLTVGLVQMAAPPTRKRILPRQSPACVVPLRAAPRWSVSRSCSAPSTSARTENHDFFKLAEPIPGPSTDQLGKVAKELGVVIIASLFPAERLYHNTAAMIEADGSVMGKVPQDAHSR